MENLAFLYYHARDFFSTRSKDIVILEDVAVRYKRDSSTSVGMTEGVVVYLGVILFDFMENLAFLYYHARDFFSTRSKDIAVLEKYLISKNIKLHSHLPHSPLINFCFFSRFQPFICISLFLATSKSSYSSK